MERIYHTWEKWECYPAGFYENVPPDGMTKQDAEELYRDLLSDLEEFEHCLSRIIDEWTFSCEHYLSNDRMNRIAWLGQAALAYRHKIPAVFRGGYNLLSDVQKALADEMALKYLNKWLVSHGGEELTEGEAESKTVANLY